MFCPKARGCAVLRATPGALGRSATTTTWLCRGNGMVDHPVPGRLRYSKPTMALSIPPDPATPARVSMDVSSAQPLWGCLYVGPVPGVAPRRRNPGLYGRIPLGFPEGDSPMFPPSASSADNPSPFTSIRYSASNRAKGVAPPGPSRPPGERGHPHFCDVRLPRFPIAPTAHLMRAQTTGLGIGHQEVNPRAEGLKYPSPR